MDSTLQETLDFYTEIYDTLSAQVQNGNTAQGKILHHLQTTKSAFWLQAFSILCFPRKAHHRTAKETWRATVLQVPNKWKVDYAEDAKKIKA